MKKVELLNLNGEKVKDFKLNENIFDITPNDKVLYDAIILARASLRQGTHKTKNRSEVSGGGRKPWRQKTQISPKKQLLPYKILRYMCILVFYYPSLFWQDNYIKPFQVEP